MKQEDKLPITVHKIQCKEISKLNYHEVASEKLQTRKHIVRDISGRTSFYPKK